MRKTSKPKSPSDLKRIGTGRVRITASIKPGLEIELSKIAEEDGINKSQVLQRILTKEIIRRRRLAPGG